MDLKLASDEAGGLEAEVVEEQEGRSLQKGYSLKTMDNQKMEILTWGIFVQRCKGDDDDDDDSSDDEMAVTASVLTHQHLVVVWI